MKSRTVMLGALARVEGEGSVSLTYRDGELEQVKLRIFEPPRFFEGLLLGRRFDEAPDITARICGICPVAYQISSATAMEAALGVRVEGTLRELRRLLYCGEWIESHALHIHLLHAPDFLGYPDAIAMTADHPEEVRRGLRIKKAGNGLMRLLGGREIHPINVRVGGFYSTPSRAQLLEYRDVLSCALEDAVATTRWVATLDFPDFHTEATFVAMRHSDEYPIFEGDLAISDGGSVRIEDFENAFEEVQVRHSHALQARRVGGGPYQVGPMARFNLNRDRLSPTAAQLAGELLPEGPVTNPFQSIVVRAIEVVFALEESLRIIDTYEPPEAPSVCITPRKGVGAGCSEAPRGICYHRYAINDGGLITSARIVPPTSQNQVRIEQDLHDWVSKKPDLSDQETQRHCERIVRNYDPCISCATHFLRLEVERR